MVWRWVTMEIYFRCFCCVPRCGGPWVDYLLWCPYCDFGPCFGLFIFISILLQCLMMYLFIMCCGPDHSVWHWASLYRGAMLTPILPYHLDLSWYAAVLHGFHGCFWIDIAWRCLFSVCLDGLHLFLCFLIFLLMQWSSDCFYFPLVLFLVWHSLYGLRYCFSGPWCWFIVVEGSFTLFSVASVDLVWLGLIYPCDTFGFLFRILLWV